MEQLQKGILLSINGRLWYFGRKFFLGDNKRDTSTH